MLTFAGEAKMKTRKMVGVAGVLLITVYCGAYTVTYDFAADPWANGWMKTESTYNAFMYNTTNQVSSRGYLDCVVQRSTSTLGQAYIPLDQTYYMPNGQSGSATVTDIWLGFDLGFGARSASTQQFMIGLFNSSQDFANPDTMNALALEPHKNFVPNVSSCLQVYSETSNGGFVNTLAPTAFGSLYDEATRRFQVHYYIADGMVYADIKVGAVDEMTGIVTNVFTQNSILVYDSAASWDTVGLNAIGIRSRYASTGTSTSAKKASGKFNFDNLYFSTDGEQNMSAPSWVTPEPATLAMLGLGGLMLARRRNA
jgi:hypothetical protein